MSWQLVLTIRFNLTPYFMCQQNSVTSHYGTFKNIAKYLFLTMEFCCVVFKNILIPSKCTHFMQIVRKIIPNEKTHLHSWVICSLFQESHIKSCYLHSAWFKKVKIKLTYIFEQLFFIIILKIQRNYNCYNSVSHTASPSSI